MEFAGKSVWATLSNVYWIDGEKLKVDLATLRGIDPSFVIDQLKKYEDANTPYVEHDFDNEHVSRENGHYER